MLGGLALLGLDQPRDGIEASTVTFRELEPPLLEAYLASGEWSGRAGSYAIQGLGSALVTAVKGDISNVIGLPIPCCSGSPRSSPRRTDPAKPRILGILGRSDTLLATSHKGLDG